MTSATSLTDIAALLLFQDIRQGMQNGRIADLNTAQAVVDAAIAELKSKQLPEEPTHVNDFIGKLLLEIGSLHQKVAECEEQLADFHTQEIALQDDITRIVARVDACVLLVEQQEQQDAELLTAITKTAARTEACVSRVEQQHQENAKVLAAMEATKSNVSTTPHPPCVAPAPSPIDATFHPAPSRVAVVSFPGGPRTITIHPPDHPNYQSIIRDENGDVIVDFRRTKPLRREGAFRGPLEDIDWLEITRVCGRAPEKPGSRAVPPDPRWPDRSQPSSQFPTSSRGPRDLIARQRQLSTSLQTDLFRRILAPEDLCNANSPSLPTGMSFSSSQDSDSSLSAKPETVSTSSSTPPSPSEGRGRKRSRNGEDDDDGLIISEAAREEATLVTDPLSTSVKESITPMSAKREESHSPEGPAKRKKLRSSVSAEGLSIAGESV